MVDISLLPVGSNVLIQQANANLGGYTPADIAGAAPPAQTLRRMSVAVALNNPTIPPTAAQIGAAITAAGQNIQANLTTPDMQMIANWATGGE